MSNSSIQSIDRTLSAVTTLGQSEVGSNGNEGVLRIPGTSPSDCLMSYPGYLLGGLTPLQRYSQCILPSQPTWLFFHMEEMGEISSWKQYW